MSLFDPSYGKICMGIEEDIVDVTRLALIGALVRLPNS